jgi:hypothetical protein
MPADRTRPVIHWLIAVTLSGFCLGAVSASPGCSRRASTSADTHATPAHLKLMQEKGRAFMRSKTTKRLSGPAAPKSASP